jgi:hypothetical protein
MIAFKDVAWSAVCIASLICSIAGCSGSSEIELAQARAEARAAHEETLKLKAELAKLLAESQRANNVDGNADDAMNDPPVELTEIKHEQTPEPQSLSQGGVVIFSDGTSREFKGIKGIRREEGGVTLTGRTVPARTYEEEAINIEDWNEGRNIYAFNQLAELRFEPVDPRDREAYEEAARQSGDYKSNFQDTYPQYVEVTSLTGSKVRFRYSNFSVPLLVTWANGLGKTEFQFYSAEVRNGLVFAMKK